MTTTDTTASEMTDSLTGYDEIAIEQAFDGFDIYIDAERHPVRSLRALIFVHQRREDGVSDAAARTAAAEMPLSEVNVYFAPDEEINEADPDTDAGKDDSPLETEPSGSQTSATQPEYNQASIPA